MPKDWDTIREKLFHDYQATLPADERCAKLGESICDNREQFDGFVCTRTKGHTGDHIAHGSLKTVARWKQYT